MTNFSDKFFRKPLAFKYLKGFTLLEVIISVAVLAVISTASVASMLQFIKSREAIDKSQAKLEEINTFFLFLDRDLSYAVPRPLKAGKDNDLYAAMEIYANNPRNPGELMQFTTSYPIPGSVAQRTQRVSWRLDDNNIYRVVWDFLDHSNEFSLQDDKEGVIQQHMLSEVDSVNINIFVGSGDESSVSFFNEGVIESETDTDSLYRLPRLVEIEIERDDNISYKRMFYIHSSSDRAGFR